jgi:small-conductance mechanosensitive channel
MRFRPARHVAALSFLWCVAATVQAEAPAPKPQAAASATTAQVKLNDTVVLTLSHGDGLRSAAERAKLANQALARALREGEVETHLERRANSIAVYAGKIELFALGTNDAGEHDLSAFATRAADRAEDALSDEQRRTELAHTVLSISLVVFFGLIALYVLRRTGEFAARARAWIAQNPERLGGIRLQTFDVVGPGAVRGAVTVMLFVARWLLQLGVVYVWLVSTLSLFASTRPYTQRLTGFVLTPLSDLTVRLAASLPLLLVAFVSGAAVFVLLRFVRLFFASVARGETKLTWLPADLAHATSVLVSLGIIVTTLVFAAPVVTGDPEGALSRTGGVLLLALGLALTPLLASGLCGAVVVYGRRLRVGQRVEIAAHRGRVRELTLLDVRLLGEDGAEIRVPHLFALLHATRVLGERRRLEVEVALAPGVAIAEARGVMTEAARPLGDDAAVELRELDAGGGVYRVSVKAHARFGEGDLRVAVVEALAAAGMGLGHARSERAGRAR